MYRIAVLTQVTLVHALQARGSSYLCENKTFIGICCQTQGIDIGLANPIILVHVSNHNLPIHAMAIDLN